MLKIFLFSPVTVSFNADPGCFFIRAGLLALLKRAFPLSVFYPVSDVAPSPEHLKLADPSDSIFILSGVPAHFYNKTKCFWDWDIFHIADKLVKRGVKVYDISGYSSLPLPLLPFKTSLSLLSDNPRNTTVASIQSRFSFCAPRDEFSASFLSDFSSNVRLLPCTGFYSDLFFSSVSPFPPSYICVLRKVPGKVQELRNIIECALLDHGNLPLHFVVHTKSDYDFVLPFIPPGYKPLLIWWPESLFSLYSSAVKVLSLRLHASIPALITGSQVCNIAIDTRSSALSTVNIPFSTIDDFADSDFSPSYYSLDKQSLFNHSLYIKLFQDVIDV